MASLLGLGAELSAGAGGEFLRLGRQVLAAPPAGVGRGGRSELNGDGTPLQLCISCDGAGARSRWVGDPAWEAADPVARLRLSRDAMRDVFQSAGAASLLPAAETLVDGLVPAEETRLRDVKRGFLWLAAGRGGAAVYVDSAASGEAGWERAAAAAATAVVDTGPATAALAELRASARLASLGIEGASPEDARLKVYFRLQRPQLLAELGPSLLAAPGLAAFLATVVADSTMNLSGAVFGLGFSLRSGALVDAKVDLCGHCLPRPAAAWRDLLARLAELYGVVPLPEAAQRALVERHVEVAFVGLGLTTDGRCRLNSYLKTSAEAPDVAAPRRFPPSHSLREVRRRAVSALLERQDPRGGWFDFRLPVGHATEWTTAYAALALSATPEERDLAGPAVQQAARWLTRSRAYAAGWGFNDRTGPDADSTGFALRALEAAGEPVPAADRAWLRERWQATGGIATYDGPGAWGHAHPCVTAAAFLALDAAQRLALRSAVLDYVASTRLGDGQWPSYWWRTHSYSTWHHVRLLELLGAPTAVPTPAEPEPGATAFDLAWRVALSTRGGPRVVRRHLLDALVALQDDDGAFPGAPELRVTDPDCADPWIEPRGRLYTDHAGVLATASALTALNEVLRD